MEDRAQQAKAKAENNARGRKGDGEKPRKQTARPEHLPKAAVGYKAPGATVTR